MGKRCGEPYDPQLRQTEHGARLYNAWKKLRSNPHCEEWDWFPAFYNWAMRCGYTRRSWLRLVDESKPYCPENCVWRSAYSEESTPTADAKTWEYEWNKAVNRIRKYYGMPPLEGTNYDDI